MKKLIIAASMVLSVLLLVGGSASALDRHSWGGHRGGGHRGHFGFGLFIGPPAVYYSPPSYYYPSPNRVWVPGYWDWRWSGRGWVRIWIPGYWQWR